MKLADVVTGFCFGSVVVAAVAALYGWIANIVKLIAMFDGDVTAMFIGRVVGVFFAPLGAVLGFF